MLEIMIVVVLMGLMAVAVTLSFNTSTPKQELEKQAKRFMASTQLVLNETVLSGQFLGIVVKPDSYQFVIYKDDKWQSLENDRVLTERKMEKGMTLSIVVDGLPLKQSDEEDSDRLFDDSEQFTLEDEHDKKTNPQPQILLFPSGELSPFELTFEMDDAHGKEFDVLVVGDALGRVTLGRPDETP